MEYVLEDHFPLICPGSHCRYNLRHGYFMERICFLPGSYQFSKKQTVNPRTMGFPRAIYSQHSRNACSVDTINSAIIAFLRCFGRKTYKRHDSRCRERIGDYGSV